ncbi:MAG TPA: V-type ATP synthase subunit F [Candidatus Acidoferrales bacterium]|nr:V-type ATP synthase subunit F [Candidatus Acidoferrales bacterium]
MAKIVVITRPAQAAGFALAGAESYSAANAGEAKEILLRLMEDPEVGVVAIDAGYLNALDQTTRTQVSESYAPVVVALPSGLPTEAGERPGEQIAEMIRRAIGFRISFKER